MTYELYNADAILLLPNIKANHIISDPPYEDEMHRAMGKVGKVSNNVMLNNRFDPFNFDGINSQRNQIARLCVEASQGWLLLFSLAEGVRAWRDDIQAAGGKWDTTCAWIKPDSAPRFNGQGPARGFENFVTAWCGKGYRKWNCGGRRGVFEYPCNPSDRDGRHPTEKPLALMKDMVLSFTQPGDTVLDPFMGSGTTGIACVTLGRKFIGIEKNPDYYKIAMERIGNAAKQGSLFEQSQLEIQQRL